MSVVKGSRKLLLQPNYAQVAMIVSIHKIWETVSSSYSTCISSPAKLYFQLLQMLSKRVATGNVLKYQ